jgi:hypothetical protein
MSLTRRYLLSLVFFLVFSKLFAGVDVNVYDDVVYGYLDKLYAGGLLKTYMPHQRPLTRYVVANLISEAKQNAKDGNPLRSIIAELEREFSDAFQSKRFDFIPLDSFSFSYTATDQKESPVIANNGLGSTSGRVQPLLSYNNGDHFDKNANIYSYSVHRIRATPYFAAYLQPKYFARSGADSTGGVGLYRGYVKTGYKNFELQVGRDDIRWGPGENGLFFSGNSRPLDMIKVSTPSPFRLPGALRNLGDIRGTVYFSFLGHDYTPANSILSGYRIDYSPFKWWDFGYDHAVFLWGNGRVGPDFTTAVRSFVGFLSSSNNDRADSNHLMGMDTTLHIPHAMGTEVYVKLLIEDTNKNTGYMLTTNAGWLGGAYLPKINGLENLSIRGEFIYTGSLPYRHALYTDGFVLENKFIGYDAGPDTWSGSASSKYQFNFDEFVKVDLRYLRRSSDQFETFPNIAGYPTTNFKIANAPEEGNYIFKLAGQKRLSRLCNLYAEAGYDRKSNADFVLAKSANDFSFQVRLTVRHLLQFEKSIP